MAKFRGYTFTLNNYTDGDIKMIDEMDVQYVAYSKEVAPTTGTPHLQGFLYFVNQRSFNAVKKLLPRAHVEAIRGTFAQNEKYCSKSSELIVRGEPPKDPKRMGDVEKLRWEEILNKAKKNLLNEIEPEVVVRCYRTLKEIARDHMAKVAHADGCTGIWVYGEAGCGKSRWAHDTYPDLYIKGLNKWWDGYQGEDVVLIDDIDPEIGRCLRAHLKHWTDRYPFKAETKGGAMQIRPKTVIITSQYSIAGCFGDRETVDALSRRCKIIFLGKEVS